ncbi:acetyl-CoA carboxylase biotin carboxylase subunit [Psychrobacter cryohalolentis]|uniref:Biotin carboxylase n=1 Tax=Psychrobacter cryohalolentis (strain ATCC BAA-1226 / DSM 17306 / VKM B-2378 / K5) TaxID=335284 RepID=Q1QDX7_PSYCK|nr:acetyl/propionyl/methylcrotonyl-CoA carboxylase subunit alpha [Psychrobacter cryohalolentis]ABE74126.1 3-methylcrotonoyl-CoA carboxylase, alpha subunit [Psychrobacter cryohalolentis K5]ASE26761.1 acetyl/propionyl/methylcrotonyl-CoA carboxylase subunit alpha [Psychrobacter cryohalolentis]
MFSKILIANRGEIACRVAATAKRLGVSTVAVYSDADREAKHVAVCDEAVYLGGSAPKDSYLKGDAIIAIAKETGAQAIHPGYGFLSENADFAQACQDADLVFIGPSADAIRAMGGKSESKRLMETAGVPLIPGYHGENQDGAFLKQQADSIGYPVLIKASAGGGGKGMRIVEQSSDFIDLLESCRREAITSFGNDQVLVEKYALKPRHIEIQVFGDTHGNYVHLFERDCSVQRRHQKVLEEAPAPGVDAAMREAMGTAAIEAARAVNYFGAGTVEFIVEQREGSMNFYFMEMNTRLQVEHPVSEAISGVDLVEWQLLVAAGLPLPKKQEELTINGHAIEARICAENPDNGFLPATGTLFTYQKPEHSTFVINKDGTGVRIDDGVREGDVISPFYDSMIAKLIVHAPTREQALAKLDRALAQTRIVGLPNNVAFLRYILNTESFSQANLDTALIEREREQLFDQHPLELSTLAVTAIAQQLASESTTQGSDPFSKPTGFRAFSDYTRSFSLVYNEQSYKALISNWHNASCSDNKKGSDNLSSFTLVIGKEVAKTQDNSNANIAAQTESVYEGEVSYASIDAHNHTLWLDGARINAQSWTNHETVYVFTDNGRDEITLVDIMAHVGEENAAVGSLKSPMPGQVVAFKVAIGDSVKKGEPLAVIEAMKIEHTITAPTDGVVAELLFGAGDLVADGDELLRIDSQENQ